MVVTPPKTMGYYGFPVDVPLNQSIIHQVYAYGCKTERVSTAIFEVDARGGWVGVG